MIPNQYLKNTTNNDRKDGKRMYVIVFSIFTFLISSFIYLFLCPQKETQLVYSG